ncbi:hypothetical protein KKB28_00055 [bacterium]|nr:hypothetical protein [bacterium]
MKKASSKVKPRCTCGCQSWVPRPEQKTRKATPILICIRCGREQTVSRTTYALYKHLCGSRKVGQEFRELYDIT